MAKQVSASAVDVNLATIISRQMAATRNWLTAQDFVEIFTPSLTRIKRRPFTQTFGVSSPEVNFDGALRVSADLFLAKALSGGIKKAYTIASRFRAEPTDDTSHLAEFQLGELWSPGKFEDVFKHAEGLMEGVLNEILGKSTPIAKNRARQLEKIRFPLPRVSFEEAIKKVGLRPHREFDLNSSEQLVKAFGASPVFITHHPVDYDPCFTDLRQDSSGSVLSTDLVFPFSGEVLTGGEVETNEGALSRQVKGSRFLRELIRLGGSAEQLAAYVKIVSTLDGPHIKMGFGSERLTQFLVGTNDITKAALFPVTLQRTAGLIIVVIDRVVIIVTDPEPI